MDISLATAGIGYCHLGTVLDPDRGWMWRTALPPCGSHEKQLKQATVLPPGGSYHETPTVLRPGGGSRVRDWWPMRTGADRSWSKLVVRAAEAIVWRRRATHETTHTETAE